MKYYALVDCNNFYASCERSFRPDLNGKPIVILSNNDGCIISRSSEAKALDIDMGVPYWEVKNILEEQNVRVFSSNYPLYGDMSKRIMNTLNEHCSDIEVYSIDESFLKFSFYKQNEQELFEHCKWLKELIQRSTGVPVSIGISKTKTLCKMANHLAKKYSRAGVYFLHTDDPILKNIAITKIWGIAKGYQKRLEKIGVATVKQLQQVSEQWMKGEFGVVGLRMIKELNGIPCYNLDSPISSRKNIMVSRSFSRDVYTLAELKESISVYATRLGEKLRKFKQTARVIHLFISANSFKNRRKDGRVYFSQTVELPFPTANTNELIQYANNAITFLYEEGTNYKKGGIMASELQRDDCIQTNLFEPIDKRLKFQKAMKAMDAINKNFGRNKLYFASCGKPAQRKWARKAQWESPKYTTRWEDILKVK